VSIVAVLRRIESAVGRFNRWFGASAVAMNTEQGRTINAMDVSALTYELKQPPPPDQQKPRSS
jgi:hypothetical protein